MNAKARITFWAISTLLAFTIFIVAGFFFWLFRHKPDFQQRQTEGVNFGRSTDYDGCWREAVRRQKELKDFGESLQNTSFLFSCLVTSAPSPGFCEGVPERLEIFSGVQWTEKRCAGMNLGTNDCRALLRTVQMFCEQERKRQKKVSQGVPSEGKTQ
jgi:hypothetical protein